MDIIPLPEKGLARRGWQGVGVVAFIDGPVFVYGVPDRIKPIRNLPEGAKVRYRFRAVAEGFAFVRTGEDVRQWTLHDRGDHWMLGCCHGANGPLSSEIVNEVSSFSVPHAPP